MFFPSKPNLKASEGKAPKHAESAKSLRVKATVYYWKQSGGCCGHVTVKIDVSDGRTHYVSHGTLSVPWVLNFVWGQPEETVELPAVEMNSTDIDGVIPDWCKPNVEVVTRFNELSQIKWQL